MRQVRMFVDFASAATVKQQRQKMIMSKLGRILLVGLCLLTACQNNDLPTSPEKNQEGIPFKIQCDNRYANDSTEINATKADNSMAAGYDHVEIVVTTRDGEVVPGLKGLYDPTTSEVRVSGLQAGEYQLLILGVKGDMTKDGATFNSIKNLNEEWLTFPADIKPLTAEYYYSQTPFSVVATSTASGNTLSAVVDGEIMQHRIIGRTDFSFGYSTLSIETAMQSKRATLTSPAFCTAFTGNGQFTGRSNGNSIALNLDETTSYLFPPTVDGESLNGEIEISARSYRGADVWQTYSFALENITANAIGQINTPIAHPDNESAALFVTEKTYEKTGLEYILQDGESKSVYTNSGQRSFNTTKPLQIAVQDDGRLHVRFYSPRPLTDVLIQAKVPSISNEYFDLAYFDSIPGFADFYGELPMLEHKTFSVTESGQIIEIESVSLEALKTATFQVVSSDPYWEKLKSIKTAFSISFGLYGGNPDLANGGPAGNWMGIRPVHCREVVAIFLNVAYMSWMPEYEQLLQNNANKLYNDSGAPVAPATVLNQLRASRSLLVGLVYAGNGVVGLGGGTVFGVYQDAYFQHYSSTYSCELIFHELGHVLGYGHSSAFTYGPWANTLTNSFYTQNLSQLPINSASYLNSKQNPNKY